MKKLIEMFGRNKVRQFNLTAAEQFVKENDISMKIEKRGGRFHQERLGEFSVFSTAELITVITFLKRKVSSHLWMNAVIGAILNQQITITLSLEGNSYD